SSRRRHTRFSRDWSSDVCSSDLIGKEGETISPKPRGLHSARCGIWEDANASPLELLCLLQRDAGAFSEQNNNAHLLKRAFSISKVKCRQAIRRTFHQEHLFAI